GPRGRPELPDRRGSGGLGTGPLATDRGGGRRRRPDLGRRFRTAGGHSRPVAGVEGQSMAEFAAVDVIRAKRDGYELTDAQIDWVVDAYTRGVVADEQMSALTMAILLNGMTRQEVSRW